MCRLHCKGCPAIGPVGDRWCSQRFQGGVCSPWQARDLVNPAVVWGSRRISWPNGCDVFPCPPLLLCNRVERPQNQHYKTPRYYTLYQRIPCYCGLRTPAAYQAIFPKKPHYTAIFLAIIIRIYGVRRTKISRYAAAAYRGYGPKKPQNIS